ncbi:MAG: 3-mercaptopyruvate sulfurtransferase [Alphaproteobacteria bacterium]
MNGWKNPDAVVTTEWLAAHLDDPKVKIVDGSYHLPNVKRDGDAEYRAAHIPGAVRFDIDAVCDGKNPLPHMLPTADVFAIAAGALGISNGDRVVVYDTTGNFSAPRVWWMFRIMGHDNVAVLDGGLPQWQAEGRKVTATLPAIRPAKFAATLRPDMVRSLDQVRGTIDGKGELVVDVRAPGRFDGTVPEIRPGVRSGHIPAAVNLPYERVLDHGRFRSAAEIEAAAKAAGLAPGRRVITSCGSGVTACIVGLALHLTGRDDWAVYDGSWTEWGGRSDTPVAV